MNTLRRQPTKLSSLALKLIQVLVLSAAWCTSGAASTPQQDLAELKQLYEDAKSGKTIIVGGAPMKPGALRPAPTYYTVSRTILEREVREHVYRVSAFATPFSRTNAGITLSEEIAGQVMREIVPAIMKEYEQQSCDAAPAPSAPGDDDGCRINVPSSISPESWCKPSAPG